MQAPPSIHRWVFLAGIFLLVKVAHAAEFHVATDGKDENPGTPAAPFATVQRAEKAAAPGDTVFIHGGTYRMTEAQIARTRRDCCQVTLLDKSGAPGKPIRYFAFPGERPVFDFSDVKPPGCRVTAFHVDGSWLHLKGIEVTGVQVTITGHTQSICFDNQGSHNIYEQLRMHDGQAIGFWFGRGSDNLVLNCDAYRNHDSHLGKQEGRQRRRLRLPVPEGQRGQCFPRLPRLVQQRRRLRLHQRRGAGAHRELLGVLQRLSTGVQKPRRRQRLQARAATAAGRRKTCRRRFPAT